MQEVFEYQSELEGLTGVTSAQNESSEPVAPREDEYLKRLSSNLTSSNTNCEPVKQAMIQKTLAEEALVISHEVYNEILALTNSHKGYADVERIKRKAEAAHLQVQDEAIKACKAVDLASTKCAGKRATTMRGLQDDTELVQEVGTATAAVLESHIALSDEKLAQDEMEETIALIDFDPTMSQLEASVKKDEKILKNHLNAIETEIDDVESELQQAASGPKVTGL